MLESAFYCVIGYFVLTVVLYFFSDVLIFLPQKSTYKDSAQILKLTTENGNTISAVYLETKNSKYTILFSHGNGEDLGMVLPYLKLYQSHGYSIFAYDYQGYGTSEGRASEKHTYQDILEAYAYLKEVLRIPPKRILVHGRSVGTGPSVELAIKRDIGGLILESGMISAFRAFTYLPLFPIDRFENLKKIPRVDVPVLLIHGTDDKLLNMWNTETLYKAIKTEKQFLRVEGAGHNNVVNVAGDRYWKALEEYLDSL